MRNRLLVGLGSAALLVGLVGGPALASGPSPVGSALPRLITSLGLRPALTGCAAVVASSAHCDSRELVRPNGVPFATSGPSGYGRPNCGAPTTCRCRVAGGSRQTVALVDAMDDPNAEADLGVYRSLRPRRLYHGDGCFRKVNESGVQGPYPAANTGWATEISLDIEMVSESARTAISCWSRPTAPAGRIWRPGKHRRPPRGRPRSATATGGASPAARRHGRQLHPHRRRRHRIVR